MSTTIKQVRQDLASQIASGISLGDWEPEHLEVIFREHLALQKALKDILEAIPTIRHALDCSSFVVIRNAQRLIGK